MKKHSIYISLFFLVFVTGCYQDEVIPSKPGIALPPVADLQYEVRDTGVTLSWKLPTSFSEDIIQPVSVQVRISVNGHNAGTHILPNAPESYSYPSYDPSKTYRFTVKVIGDVDTADPHVSDLRYSLGKTVAF